MHLNFEVPENWLWVMEESQVPKQTSAIGMGGTLSKFSSL